MSRNSRGQVTITLGRGQADEQQTVDGLLHMLGLRKYAIIIKVEEIDMTALKQMGENDLKELRKPMVNLQEDWSISEQLDVFNEVWYYLFLNNRQAIKVIDAIQKWIKTRDGIFFLQHVLVNRRNFIHKSS